MTSVKQFSSTPFEHTKAEKSKAPKDSDKSIPTLEQPVWNWVDWNVVARVSSITTNPIPSGRHCPPSVKVMTSPTEMHPSYNGPSFDPAATQTVDGLKPLVSMQVKTSSGSKGRSSQSLPVYTKESSLTHPPKQLQSGVPTAINSSQGRFPLFSVHVMSTST